MDCRDVSEYFSVSSRSGTSLTERALAHAHVAQCADCQAEPASIALVPSARPEVEPLPGRATAQLRAQIRLVITRLAPSLSWLRAASRSAVLGAARTAREVTVTEVTRSLGALSRFRMLVSRSLTVSTRAAVRAIEGTWAGLIRAAWWLPTVIAPSARAAAGLVGRVRFVSADVRRRLARLGSAATRACHEAARTACEVAATEVTRSLGALSRFRMLVSRSLTVSTRAAVRAIEGTWAGLIRAAWWLTTVVAPSARAAAGLVGRVRFVSAGVPRRLARLGSAATRACHEAARTACEVAATDAMLVLGALTRLRLLMSRSLTVSTGATVRTIEDAWARLAGAALRLPPLVVPSARAAAGLVGRARFVSAGVPQRLARLGLVGMIACRDAGRAVSGPVGAAVGGVSRSAARTVRAADSAIVRAGTRLPALLASSARTVVQVVGMAPDRVRAYPRVSVGVASGAVLLASLLFLGPRHGSDNLGPRFSPSEQLLQDARLPVDPKPAEPIVTTPLVSQVTPVRRSSGPLPVPPPRVAAPERHAAIPAPVRRSEPAAAATTPTAEPSDPAAAIDWLLKNSGRRPAESP